MKAHYWLFIFFFSQLPTAFAAPPSVVVTIPPLHALVNGVMDGVAKPTLLLSNGNSPHTYSLRPSQMRALQQAELLVWVGENLEGFLQRPLAGLPKTVTVLTALNLPELQRLPARTGGMWEGHHHHEEAHDEEEHEAHEAHEADAEYQDPHVWLSPANAVVIVQAVAQQLSQLDPEHAARYQANAQQLQQRLQQFDAQLQAQLAPVREKPYFVFHDAYQYFEHHYQLNALGALSISPEQRPSAKRISELRARIQQQSVSCVFREPQFQSSLVDILLEDTNAKQGVLDPLGVNLTGQAAEAYFMLLQQLVDNLLACLQ